MNFIYFKGEQSTEFLVPRLVCPLVDNETSNIRKYTTDLY